VFTAISPQLELNCYNDPFHICAQMAWEDLPTTNAMGGFAHNYCRYTGTGVVVTIVDDGMEHDHPDLEQNYDAEASTDLNGNDRDPYPNIRDPINKHGAQHALGVHPHSLTLLT
jgi:hypothetical protein